MRTTDDLRRTRRPARAGRYALLALIGALVGLYVAGWALARPVMAVVGPPPASLDAELVAFSSESGSMIHGWFSSAPAARASLLLLPGVRANRLSMVQRAEFLRRAGYSILLIDFQATGESDGDAITFGWRERLDVLAAVHYLRTRMPGRPVGIIGFSLGGAATLLAAPALHVDAAVLEAVYPSIDRAVVNRLEMQAGPFGKMAAPLLLLQLRPRLGITSDDLKPVDHIAQIGCPVLVASGTADRHTTMEDTRVLFEAAREPKELWWVEGATHVDLLEFAGDRYRQRILAFLGGVFGRRSTA